MVKKLRTAVLVVHGMGSQRPLETVRGVINAVWFDDDDHNKGSKKLSSRAERRRSRSHGDDDQRNSGNDRRA
jgi:hypothetical protein